MNTEKVTRFEIIDHRKCQACGGQGRVHDGTEFGKPCEMCYGMGMRGRDIVVHNQNVSIEARLQDDDRTLKIFIEERQEDEKAY